MILKIETPEWAEPLLAPHRYKGVKGGRGSGKSHFFADALVESIVINPNTSIVCIREIQKSLKFSAKKLIEDKIFSMGVSHLFDVTLTEIRALQGNGIIIFQGMQDHTADSIKSLEGFDIAWVEEAHSLSKKSLQLLRPTIRAQNSEIWFSWNPQAPTDAVDEFFESNPQDSVLIHVNIYENPFAPQTLLDECEEDKKKLDPEDFAHIWLGEYNLQSDSLVFPPKALQRFTMDAINLHNKVGVISFIDVADEGEDSLCQPIGYLIGQYIYIVDVIHTQENSDYTIPLCAAKINEHKVNNTGVETNGMGSMFYKGLISRTKPTSAVLPIISTGNKHKRIIANAHVIRQYVKFRTDYEVGSDYDKFMREIFQYTKSGKKPNGKPIKHDDAPDAVTGLVVLGRELYG